MLNFNKISDGVSCKAVFVCMNRSAGHLFMQCSWAWRWAISQIYEELRWSSASFPTMERWNLMRQLALDAKVTNDFILVIFFSSHGKREQSVNCLCRYSPHIHSMALHKQSVCQSRRDVQVEFQFAAIAVTPSRFTFFFQVWRFWFPPENDVDLDWWVEVP